MAERLFRYHQVEQGPVSALRCPSLDMGPGTARSPRADARWRVTADCDNTRGHVEHRLMVALQASLSSSALVLQPQEGNISTGCTRTFFGNTLHWTLRLLQIHQRRFGNFNKLLADRRSTSALCEGRVAPSWTGIGRLSTCWGAAGTYSPLPSGMGQRNGLLSKKRTRPFVELFLLRSTSSTGSLRQSLWRTSAYWLDFLLHSWPRKPRTSKAPLTQRYADGTAAPWTPRPYQVAGNAGTQSTSLKRKSSNTSRILQQLLYRGVVDELGTWKGGGVPFPSGRSEEPWDRSCPEC